MLILVVCYYCGHEERVYVYGFNQELKCSKCQDTNLKRIDPKQEDNDPFGYNKS